MAVSRIKSKRKSKALVLGYLERVSSKIFSDFPKQLTNLVGKQHGVYALYKGKRLYYVGLATNLRSRIKQHLKDKHSGKWVKFSLYLVHKADHIKELETIVMRIANPEGNTAGGKLPEAENLKAELLQRIKAEQGRQLDGILGGKGRTKSVIAIRKGSSTKAKPGKVSELVKYIGKRGFPIRGKYKGQVYQARAHKNGTISFEGNLYATPSGAARAVRKQRVNGWNFWKYRNSKGEWVKLNEIRK